MEGIDMEVPPSPASQFADDFCVSILSRFSNSQKEDHQRLCSVIGTMSQELKDQNIPSTPIAYFGATCSSLDRLSREPEPPSHAVEALLTILSLLLPRISAAILKKKRDYLSELIDRSLRCKSLSATGAASAVKCIAHLLIIRDGANWSDMSRLYGILVGFITDHRLKVRKQCQLSTRDVLQTLQGTPALSPASEVITNKLAKCILLAGGSNENETEGSKGAQEILFILDALKDCLPLMSLKHTTSTLKYFKPLVELRMARVSRHVTDSVYAFCLHPTSEVSPEALLDLLGSLDPTKDTTADGMTFTARILDVGMKKVYSLNRQICVVKLPAAFNKLKEILASKHEEAIYAAMDAFKSLINTCIDESLIKQGVDQIMTNTHTNTRLSGPTIIEKVCAIIESLLDYPFADVWDVVFQIVSVMFDKLGKSSSHLLSGTLKGLAEMQKLPDEALPNRKQLHECVGSALGAMGPETFLGLLPLKLESEDLSEANIWLFPILKQYTVGARLGFFTDEMLGMVGLIKQKSQKLEREGRIIASRSTDALVNSLWSLLPSFCNYPLDTAESFKNLKETLCKALCESPDVCGIVCYSLQILIQQNKRVLEEKDDKSSTELSIATQQALSHYTPQVAAHNLSVLKSSALDMLSVLRDIFLESVKDDGGCLQSTIGEFASISDRKVIARFFQRTMQNLLEVTKEAAAEEAAGKEENSRGSNSMRIDSSSKESSPSHNRAKLLDLAVALLPGLISSEIKVLFSPVRLALKDKEGSIQKKAYKALSVILRNCDWFLSSKVDELLELMIEVLPKCHFSAKHYRLDCLHLLIVHVSKYNSEQMRHGVISSFLTEIVLALKESNKKTRNRAYEILVQIGHACGDEENGGKKENLYQLFSMVAGGLAGETPHMISAAVKGLARLAYEFSDLVSTAYNVIPSTLLLLQRKNREIIKANLGLLKVLVAKSQGEELQMHLRSLVEGLLKWQDDTKTHFKAKVKLLLEMLVKKCGLDAVKAVMPEDHMKLLTNIRKIKERKERKVESNSEENKSHFSKATTSRQSRWNHTKIFSDFGDEDDSDAETMDGETIAGRRGRASSQLKSKASLLRSKRTRNADKSLPEDLFDQYEDEPLDLLDRNKTRSALQSSGHLKRKVESDDEPEIDSSGRMVIHEGGKLKRERPSGPDSDSKSEAAYSAKSSMKNQKRRKTSTSDSGWAYTGSEYASKKAAGDLKRKDKLEPYAYWPLDRKMMSRRPEHRAAARKGMSSVVKMTKRLEGKSASSALLMKGLRFKRGVQKKSSKKKTR